MIDCVIVLDGDDVVFTYFGVQCKLVGAHIVLHANLFKVASNITDVFLFFTVWAGVFLAHCYLQLHYEIDTGQYVIAMCADGFKLIRNIVYKLSCNDFV